jgi:hypothetical protein
MRLYLKYIFAITSAIIGFLLIKNVDSWNDLIKLLVGIALFLLIPAALIATHIAFLFSRFIVSNLIPFCEGTQDSVLSAYHKVAEVKRINRPEEALKDYEIILQKWPGDVNAYLAIISIYYLDLKDREDAEHCYFAALECVRPRDKQLIQSAWVEFQNRVPGG